MQLIDSYNLMHEGALAMGRAELKGMRVDTAYIHKAKRRLTSQISKLLKELEQTDLVIDWRKRFTSNFNLNSPLQLREILYKVYKLDSGKKTKAGYGSTDEEALKGLDVPGLDLFLRVKKLTKIRDVYLEAFEREQVKGYVHPFFNLHTVRTFRSSSDKPNFQNIPIRDKEAMKIVRGAIFARLGHQLMEADFSKLEVSISACYHKDPVMLKYLTSEHNDMHADLAAQIFMIQNFDKHIPEHSYLRKATKNGFIFPQFYGDYYVNNAEGLRQWIKISKGRYKKEEGVKMPGGITIAEHLIAKGITSQKLFINHIQDIEYDFWNNRFRVYKQWKEKWVKDYQKKGYFYSLTGFRYSGIMRRNEVINYPVQGAASHCLLWSFTFLDKWLKENNMDTCLVGQVHDSMILDVNPAELTAVYHKIREIIMVELPKFWKWIIVPLEIEFDLTDVDKPWSTKYEYKI